MATQAPQPSEIPSLIDALSGRTQMAPWKARETLVAAGQIAVPALTGALTGDRAEMRWEAAKALSELHDPASAGALVSALENHDGSVRWIAAEALTWLGSETLDSLLHALLKNSGSEWLREGSHHVLTVLRHNGDLPPQVLPVLEALDGRAPAIAVMAPVGRALEELNLHRFAATN
jgi:hypothetical protein